jgi:hypothetical protein
MGSISAKEGKPIMPKKEEKLTPIELLVYYLGNIVSLGALWVAKIVIKKAIFEGFGDINFNIFIDTKKKKVNIIKED